MMELQEAEPTETLREGPGGNDRKPGWTVCVGGPEDLFDALMLVDASRSRSGGKTSVTPSEPGMITVLVHHPPTPVVTPPAR